MDIYREEILDHFKNPRNFGPIEKGKNWVAAEERNSSCGDVVRLGVRVGKGKVEEVRFEGEGCAISMAATSMLTEMIKGKELEWAGGLEKEALIERLGIKVSPARMRCASLGWVCLKKALRKYG